MLTEEEEQRIIDWHSELSNGISITCVVTDDERSGLFSSFCERLSSLAPGVSVTFTKGEGEARKPGIEVNEGLIYHALPEGPELSPFLEALSYQTGVSPVIPQEVMARLNELKTYSLLELFITPECPFCPRTVEDVVPLPMVNRRVKIEVIDGVLFQERTRSLGIQSAPTLVFDSRMQWTGRPPLTEVLDFVLDQDPALLSPSTMESLLGEGKAVSLADMMVEQGKIFEAFYDLLTHEKWFVRLGAMVAMEEIIEKDPSLAARCIDPLWERLSSLDEQVQGDVVYILGEAGNRDTVPYLERILSGSYSPETREAAKEALESIARREGNFNG